MKLKSAMRLALVSLLFIFSACSGDDTESLDFGFSPKEPQVIDADFSITKPADPANPTATPTVTTVAGPWVYVQPYFKNNSGGYITIQAIKLRFRGSAIGTGEDVIKEYSLDAGLLPNNVDAVTTNDTFYFAELAPGAEFKLPDFRWYLDTLPDLTQVSSLNFRISAEAIGWFGDSENPTKTLNKKIFFNTAQ